MTFDDIAQTAEEQGLLTKERLLAYVKVHVEAGNIDLDDFAHIMLDL